MNKNSRELAVEVVIAMIESNPKTVNEHGVTRSEPYDLETVNKMLESVSKTIRSMR